MGGIRWGRWILGGLAGPKLGEPIPKIALEQAIIRGDAQHIRCSWRPARALNLALSNDAYPSDLEILCESLRMWGVELGRDLVNMVSPTSRRAHQWFAQEIKLVAR